MPFSPFLRSALVCLTTIGLLPSPLAFAQTKTKTEEKVEKKEEKKAPAKVVVPVFSLSSPVTEKPAAEDLPFATGGTPESFLNLTKRLRKALDDEDVKGVVLLSGDASFGLAQTEELHRILGELKKAGKKIYAHADVLDTRRYVLLSAATHLSVTPTGYMFVTGIYGEQLYLRGLFEKLGVRPDFLTCGAYKSAAEMFMRKTASPEAKEMYGWLYDGMYDSYLTAIAQGRDVDKAQAEKWIDQGLYSAESAKEAGLIDASEYRKDFEDRIKKDLGEGVEFDRRYGKAKQKQIDLSNPFAALQIWAEILSGGKKPKSTKDAVAVVYVEGAIMPGKGTPSLFGESEGAYSDPIRKALDKVAADETVKAVVLRVDSPGGSVVASEIILKASQRVKSKKPLIVSMGNVAGSGGYYVSCGTDTIFAEPGTITGSIGVVSGKLATKEMWGKLGINFEPHQRGKRAGMMSSAAVFTPEEKAEMQSWMDDVYEDFKGHVLAVRKDRLKKPIDDLAGGRVFTGKQALENGLVDKLGGLNDAIQFAAKKADVEDYEVRVVPEPKSFFELLAADLNDSKPDDKHLRIDTAGSIWETVLPMLNGLDPHRVKAVRQAFQQLEIIQAERLSLSMPILFWD
jgi:protease IV